LDSHIGEIQTTNWPPTRKSYTRSKQSSDLEATSWR